MGNGLTFVVCPPIYSNPKHPYTQALLASSPESAIGHSRLVALSGVVPGAYDRPVGCLLNPRCPYVTDKCRTEEPNAHESAFGQVKCHTPLTIEGRPAA